MITTRTGKPSTGMSYCSGDSLPKNADPERVAPSGDAGAGVSTIRDWTVSVANLDKTRMCIVRKGVTCDLDGIRFLVQRVRLGMVYGTTLIHKKSVVVASARVRVVAA